MRKADAKLIKKFNEKYPVGSTFQWREMSIDTVPYKPLTVRSPAYDHYGMAVAFANEKRGFISVEPQFVKY